MSIQLKPGKWRTRNGRVAVVEFRTSRPSAKLAWLGYVDGGNWSWSDNGKFWLSNREAELDIIAPYTEPRLRPWKPEEVPVGAIVRAKGFGWRSLILGVTSSGGIQIHDGHFDSAYSLENHEHSTDGGKTWLPCGVMEDGE